MCRMFALVVVGLVVCAGSAVQSANIIWVSDAHQTIAGATGPDDQGWVDLLRSAGHNVNYQPPTATATGYWRTLDAAKLATLNAADLVIVSRDSDSGQHATDAAEVTQWSSIKTPLILVNVYLARSSRWLWINSTAIGARQAYFTAKAIDTQHPIFTGVNLDANGQVVWLDQSVAPGVSSYINTTDAGNGKIIAVRPDNNYLAIVEWAAGTPFYASSTQTPAGKRMLFCAGTEQTSSTSVGWGVMDLSAEGKKIFLNSVRYLVGLPMVDGIATTPNPADKATDIARDIVLGWKPGPYAATHNVYFGVNQNDVDTASVSNPKGVLAAQGLDANTFDPAGSLAFGQTYYWRVDEVNAPPTSSTVYKGTVWSFTAEPFSYKITSITATASSFDEGKGPDKTIDGSGVNAADQHATDIMTMWVTARGTAAPGWIQYDFDRVYKLHEMWVWNHNTDFESALNFGLKNVTVEYSADGNQWTSLGDFVFTQAPGSPTYAHNITIDLSGAAARHVKIVANSSWGGAQLGLSEVRFYYIPVSPREPQPASGATGLNPEVNLSWRSGREAASHQLSMSTDVNAVSNGTVPVTPVSQSSYLAANLDLGRTYYWKVVEVNDAANPSAWTGDVWSFATREYFAIDDFESYTDEEPIRVFDTWFDGYGTTTNGSQVGYTQSPFAEQTIIHGGKQSMPLTYNNATVSSSEAERQWTPAQNWTVNGANTVSLWFRGNPTGFVELASDHVLMNGMGTDIFGTADQGRFVYKQLTGNGTIVARVDRLDAVDGWSKAGVMIRQSLEAGSAWGMSVYAPGNGWRYQNRLTPSGAGASDTAAATAAQIAVRAPIWIKMERVGNTFNAYYATAEAPSTWIGSPSNPQTITMTDPVYIGLAVTSHVATPATQAEFSAIATTGNVTGQWQSADLGIPQPVGNALETFYVTLKDSAGKSVTIKHPDALAVTAGTWQEWKIPLSSLAPVDASRVKTMIIGVGDKANPKHGSGLIYIDDIQFGRPAQ